MLLQVVKFTSVALAVGHANLPTDGSQNTAIGGYLRMFRAQNRAQENAVVGVGLAEIHRYNPTGLRAIENEGQWHTLQGQLVTCRVEELRPHASYERNRFGVSASRLSALGETGDFAFHEPLIITRNGTIIDGYCRWELARQQGRTTVTCIEYDLTEEEALRWLLARHRRVEGLNAFCRILLALDLEPWLKERGRLNQSAGAQRKGSSKLTEAERVDTRSGIATAAGVSLGNVTKVKQLMTTACPEVQDALRNGEVTIHWSWLWREMSSENQRQALMLHRSKKGVRKTIRRLISRHMSENPRPTESLGIGGLTRLSRLQSLDLSSVVVAALDVPGRGVFVTAELLQILPAQEELPIS